MPVLLRSWILSLTLVACARMLAASAEPTPGRAAIDRVWAGHPVGFALLVDQGHVFVGYYDAERRLTVAARAPGSREWTRVALQGVWNEAKRRFSNVVDWDSHNGIVMALDREGYLHLSANMHGDPLVYHRTSRPLDVTSIERIDRMTGERESRCTYPKFFKDAAGELYFGYRDGSSGNGVDFYNRYDVASKSWQRHIPTPLFDGEGRRSAYATPLRLGPDGRFHVLWMWRDTPEARTNQQLSYARSPDLLHWEDAQGRKIPLPITFGQGDIIDDAKPGEGLINTTYALGFDAAGKPIAVYHRYDEAGHSQLFAARPTAEVWRRAALTEWTFRWAFGGGGSLQTDVYVFPLRRDDDGALLVPFSARAVPNGVLRVDPESLRTLAVLPPEKGALAAEELRPRSVYPGMEVRTRSVCADGVTYTLRWETLPSNRDNPRPEAPPPSELHLLETRADCGRAD